MHLNTLAEHPYFLPIYVSLECWRIKTSWYYREK